MARTRAGFFGLQRRSVLSLIPAGLLAGLLVGRSSQSKRIDLETAEALYQRPAPVQDGARQIFHLGHSLVGRDMPAMLAQLAPGPHDYNSQLGWGTSLKDHWGPSEAINGFAVENDHPRFRSAAEALDGGGYDAVVLTEMVEIRDAIRYHDSATYLSRWAERTRQANPAAIVYLYETWHETTDPEGWLVRVDRDLARYWEQQVLLPAVRTFGHPIYVIPGGQALAAVARAVVERGGVDGISRLEDFFAIAPDGTRDAIHFNDLGAYVIALTHYAVLYQRDPTGLPRALKRADGSPAEAAGPDLAQLVQSTVWRVVSGYAKTGLPGTARNTASV